MSTITTRAGKGSALTHNEVDSNFTNLNNDKYQAGGALGTPASGNLANCTFPTLNQNTTGNAATVTNGVYTTDIGSTVLAYNSNLQAFLNTFSLPVTDSTSGYVLQTNGAGTLSFVAKSSGLNLSSPPAIGNTTPNTGAFTYLSYPSQSTAPTTPANGFTLYANSSNALSWKGANGYLRSFDGTTNTANRTYTLPDLNGQILLDNNMPIGSTTPSTGAFTSVTTPSVTATTTDLTLSAISTGAVKFSTLGGLQGQFNNTASTVNYFDMFGSATTKAIQFKSNGSDSNISMAFQPKGTGAIDLAAGSSGVNISNGGTVTAITRTAAGTSYTSAPTWSASAPTTAGGVTATGTTYLALQTIPTITSGGTGYTVGDTLTFVGGSGITTATTLTVSTVSSGVITAVTISANGAYSTPPTSPISVTGGTGTGATFTTTAWGVASTIVIGTAGSGYIEQPTVTFSGGGGSGASAYASVGSGAIVKSIGSTLSFYTPGGEAFRVVDNAQSTTSYWGALGSSANTPTLRAFGTSTGNIDNNAAASLSFRTNATSSATSQFQIAHTASAVNYVQVTGAVTTGAPVISAQGSDTNIPLNAWTKGNQAFNFYTNGGSQRQFRITHTTSAVNFPYVTGSATGTAVTFGVDALSTDTNIDLALTPKGNGKIAIGAPIKELIASTTSAATITPTSDTATQYEVTALAVTATIAAPSGTPADGQKLVLRIKDNGTSQTLSWTTTSGAYRAVGVTLPSATTAGKVGYYGCIYNSQDTFWDVVAVAQL